MASGHLTDNPQPGSEIRPWDVISTEPEEDFWILRVRRQVSISPRTGEPHRVVIMDAPDWVNVIALTPDDHVVLIEQYRHGIGQVTLEIPGGMIDPGEDPTGAGLRELREETGFAGDPAELLGKVHPNPAFLSNACYTVLVRDARQIGELQQDSGEDIAVRLVPLNDIPNLIASGAITHALVIAAFHYLQLTEAK